MNGNVAVGNEKTDLRIEQREVCGELGAVSATMTAVPVVTKQISIHTFGVFVLVRLIAFGFALLIGLSVVSQAAEDRVGVVTEKPADGLFVEVDGKYMVPYTTRIPGTDISFDMVPVPGGTFLLGSPESEADRNDDEGPQITVNVPPMWVAKYEVRWEEYKEYMNLYEVFTEFEASGVRPIKSVEQPDAITAPTPLYEPTYTFEYGEEPDQPAVTMTQYAAMQYTEWLSAITGQQFRVPTEAEWEYACRAGTKTAYSWGDDADSVDDHAWYFDNAENGQLPGGQKKPNAFGLYDMHGNVAEWTVNAHTEDGYAWLADKESVNAIDVVKWPETETGCVVRGGTWEDDPEQLRSAARMVSDDGVWKNEDPNYPKSPWWFSDDPARGVGMRLFRSYEELDDKVIRKFWDHIAEDAALNVQMRMGDRGKAGLADDKLPEVIAEHFK